MLARTVQNQPTILLTGATGFLGSHLLKNFLAEGYAVVLLKRRTSDLKRIEQELPRVQAAYNLEDDGILRAFANHTIQIIAHCATDYGRSHKDPLHIVQANLMLPLTLLHEGKRHGIKIFLNTDTLLDKRINDYSLSKRQFSEWLQQASAEIVVLNVALEHFYGPNDDTSKFVSWLIDCFLSRVESIPLTLGEQKRDFIHIDDVVRAFSTILNNDSAMTPGFHRFEVGSGRSTSIRDIATEISRLCGPHPTHLDFGRLPYRANEVMESTVNLEPLNKLGWHPQVALNDGLKRTIELDKKSRELRS